MSSPRLTTVLLPPAKGRSIGGDGVDPPHGKCPWGQAGTTKLGKIRRPQMGMIQRPLTGTLVTPSEMRAKASNASNVHGQRATPA
jgi:hypothetical protein